MEELKVSFDWKHSAMQGAVVGATAAVASMLLFGELRNIEMFGQSIPAFVPIALGTGLGSIATDLTHDYLLAHIPGNQKFQMLESSALALGISGLTTYLVLSNIGGGEVRMLPTIALGAGSYVAGSYIHANLLMPVGNLL